MSWEFEDLFNNRLTEDGGFLNEPSFIPVGKMGYRRRTTVSGKRIDAEVYPVFGRQQVGYLRKAKAQAVSPAHIEAQQKANEKRSWLRLIQIVEANFTDDDVRIGLDYAGDPPDMDRVEKDIRNYLDRVRRLRKRNGLPELKAVYVIGGDEFPAATFSGKRPHVHVIMNGGIDSKKLEALWKKGQLNRNHGRANTTNLQEMSEGYGDISRYNWKNNFDRAPKKGARKWRGTKNLKRPEPRATDAKMPNGRVRRIAYNFKNEAKPIMEKLYPGCILQDVQVHFSDVIDGVYIRCVLRKIKGDVKNDKKRTRGTGGKGGA